MYIINISFSLTSLVLHRPLSLLNKMGESVSFSGQASGGVERRVVVVEQPDMYSAVLSPLMEEAEKVEKEGKAAVAEGKGEWAAL